MSVITTAEYTNLAIKGLQEPFKLAVQARLEQYKVQEFVRFYDTKEFSEIFSSLEGMNGGKKLGELETPDVASLEQGYNVTLTAGRAGLGMEVSQDTMVKAKDDTTKIDAYLMEQRNQLLKTVSRMVLVDAFAPYNEAFLSTSATLAPDGVELCGTHTYKGGTTFTNSTTAVLSESAIDTAWEYAGAFVDQGGKEMPLNWTSIMVKKGSAAAKLAKQLFASGINPTAYNDVNIYEGTLRIIETPYLTTTNKKYWFLIDSDAMISPVILGMVETPTFQDPIKQNNEAIRSNVTGYWKYGINKMPINIYGSTGAV